MKNLKNFSIMIVMMMLLQSCMVDESPKMSNVCVDATTSYVQTYENQISPFHNLSLPQLMENFYVEVNKGKLRETKEDFENFFFDDAFEIMVNAGTIPPNIPKNDFRNIIKGNTPHSLLPWMYLIPLVRNIPSIDECELTKVFWDDASNPIHTYRLYKQFKSN